MVRAPRSRRAAGGFALLFLAAMLSVASSASAGEIDLPAPDPTETIRIKADTGSRWQQGDYEVWHLRGRAAISQGDMLATGDEAVVWIDRESDLADGRNKVIAYFDGNAMVHAGGQAHEPRLEGPTWLGRFYSDNPIAIDVPRPGPEPNPKPEVFRKAMAAWGPAAPGAVRQAQFTEQAPISSQAAPLPQGMRRLTAHPRSNVLPEIKWFPNPGTNEWVAVITRGVNVIVEGVEEAGTIDISTDRLVVWTSGLNEPDLTGQTLQPRDMPLELYLEGNIVFRQGERIIHAERMYYDVRSQIGTVLLAEVLTPAPNFEGLLRLRSELIRQTGPNQFFAQDSFITSSRLGRPGYRLEAGSVYFEDIQQPLIDPFSGAQELDPNTGQPVYDHRQLASTYSNFVFLGPVPVFYWPVLATDFRDPGIFIRRVRFKNDNIFGTQVLTDLDPYELFGIENPPAGTDWDVSLDYLSERGLGFGSSFQYARGDLWGLPGNYSGFIDGWGINEQGTDNLGADRRDVPPEEDFRGRVLARHRHALPGNFQLSAELGLISDRNFLEQYFESEWDEFKDETTGLELKRIRDNASFSVTADTRINEFFTQTEWLPRADHFWLGQGLFGDRLTWYEHTNVGFARMKTASTPTNPVDLAKFALLPWEADVEGERVATRQEIDLPIQAGPVKVVPYALGEVAHWGEALDGEDLQRAYGQVGVRATLPFWSVYPNVESELFNVHGVAHKITLEGEFAYTDANENLEDLPLYDPLDDDSIEHFRRRFAFNTFGGAIPARFDERFYAARSGLAAWVTSPSTEVAEDLTAVRMGVSQRWQTKRGLPDARRIVDWIVLDTNAVLFPEADRDNFGEGLGLVDYDFRWHVGDRFALLSDGGFDFFDDGQQVVTIGGLLSRPPRGNLYLGYRSLEGPFSSQIVATSVSYRLSPKWVSSFGTTVDVGGEGNIGQNLALTRIGESLLVSFGFNVDASKDNFGVHLAIEPRFLPRTRLGRAGGVQVPIAGLYGLE